MACERRARIFGRVRTRVLVVIAFVLLSVAGVASGQEAAGLDRYVGHWRYDGTPEHGQRIIEAAVGRAVDGMGFIVSDIAAGRLRGKNQLVREIVISQAGDRVRIAFDGTRVYETALEQWTPHHTPDGESVSVLHRYHQGSLVQLFRSDSGTRRNVFRMSGDRIRLEVTVQSPSLPRAMTYSLTYRRR